MSGGQIVGTVVGAVIGFVGSGFNPAGAVKGAYWGYTAGTIIDPPPGPDTVGPRLENLTIQTSTDGAYLPIVYGTARITGNVFWSTGLTEQAVEEEVGGGSGGSSSTHTSYDYSTDVGIALCEGEIVGVRRIWGDAKLRYNISADASNAEKAASAAVDERMVIYTGSEAQNPDALMQAIDGVADTPAYRGTAYARMEDMALADFGNRLPTLSFEVVQNGTLNLVASKGKTVKSLKPWPFSPVRYKWIQSANWHTNIDDALAEAKAYYGIDSLTYFDWSPAGAESGKWSTFFPELNIEDYKTINRKYTACPYTIIPVPDQYWEGPTIYNCSALGGAGAILDSGIGYLFPRRSGTGLTEPRIVSLEHQPVVGGVNFATNCVGIPPECVVTHTWYFCYNYPPVNGYYPFGVSWKEIEIICERLVTCPVPTCSTDNVDPCIDGEVEIAPGWCLDCAGNISPKIVHTEITGSYKQLQALSIDGNGKIIKLPLPPLLEVGDSNDTQAFWEDAAAFAGIGGTYGVDYPVSATIGCQYNLVDKSLIPTDVTLQSVCEDIATRSGLDPAEYDFTALSADLVHGYVIDRTMSMRAALEPLMLAYQFDLAEVDGQIVARKRGGVVDVALSEDALGAAEQADTVRLDVTRANLTELPSEVRVQYVDMGSDYQQGTQYARRLTASHVNVRTYALPLALTSQEAARLADVLLAQAWHSERYALSFTCTYEQARLTPSDVVSLPGYGADWLARIVQVDIGMPGLVKVSAVPELAALYTSAATGADQTGIGQSLTVAGPTKMLLLDCCMLRDTDTGPGWYVAMCGYTGGAWPGGLLYKSNDGGSTWASAATVTGAQVAAIGYAQTVLPTADCRVWDKSGTVEVRLLTGSISSVTRESLLNGANAVLIGAPGRWELVQPMTVAYAAGVYTLSDLLRGRKGTEHAAGSHAIDDAVLILSAATMQDVPMASSEIAAGRQYRAVTSGQALEAVTAETHTYAGERLECLAPVLLGGGRNAAGDLTIKWVRRDRINADWLDYADVPMSETSESYEVEVWDSSYATLKRTITGLSSQTATYTAAQQTTDFSGTQSTVYVRVYQLSSVVGRGHALQGSI